MIAAGLLSAAVLAGGCGKNEAREQPSGPAPIQVGKESVATVKSEELRTGPMISGQLSAEREATVRAEVGGAVVLTSVEEGETVRNGAVLARIEARDLNDAVASAKVAVQSAEAALKLAQSEAQRTESLVKGGALAQRDLEQRTERRGDGAIAVGRGARQAVVSGSATGRHRRPRADRWRRSATRP